MRKSRAKCGNRSVSLSNWQPDYLLNYAKSRAEHPYIYPQWGIINKPCVQGSIRYVMWTIRSRMHTYLFKKILRAEIKYGRKCNMSGQCCCHKLQVANAGARCVSCLDRCTCHDGIGHRTSYTWHIWLGQRDIGHGDMGQLEKLSLFVLPARGEWRQLAQLTVGLAVGSLPSTFPGTGSGTETATIWPSADQLVNRSTRLASPGLAARSVAFFIGHIVKHVVHTCKHILQSNIGPDRHQGRATSSLVPSSPSSPSWGWPK